MIGKRGQIGGREIITIIVVVILLSVILPIFTSMLNAISSGSLESSLDAIVAGLIPLFIFAMFFEFIRRFLG